MSRRSIPLVLFATLLALGAPVPTSVATAPEPAAAGARADKPVYRFVAAPDIFNQDIADVRGERGWNPGDPNSWTERLEQSVDTVLDEIASHRPRSLLVTGDLVQGHWGDDPMRTGIFGPSRTWAQRVALLRRAGNVYHGANMKRFNSRGLTLHAAVGDHDIGDDPWGYGWATPKHFKHANVPVFRNLFAKHYTQRRNGTSRYADRPRGTQWSDTAYAVRLHRDVLLITLDVFNRTKGDVEVEVVDGQLRWLERTLAKARRAKIPWVVVQGHAPVVRPFRARQSSALTVKGGPKSPLWRTMKKGGVDLYLAGEVHATSLQTANGLTQIATGAPIFHGRAAYLTVDVYQNRMQLDVHEFRARHHGHQPIWQGASMKTEGNLTYPRPSEVVGTATLYRSGKLRNTTGNLVRYTR